MGPSLIKFVFVTEEQHYFFANFKRQLEVHKVVKKFTQ